MKTVKRRSRVSSPPAHEKRLTSHKTVTPQEVNEKAKAITAVKARMEDLLTELDGRIKTMNTEDWIGDAGSTYGNQFVLLYNQVIRSMDTVQQYANNLSHAANRYAELESTQASTAGSLDSTGIFG